MAKPGTVAGACIQRFIESYTEGFRGMTNGVGASRTSVADPSRVASAGPGHATVVVSQEDPVR